MLEEGDVINLIIIALIMLLPCFFIVIAINQRTHSAWTPASCMFYVWSVLLILATGLGDSWGYYPMNITGIFLVSFFLDIILLVFFLGCSKNIVINYEVERSNTFSLCVFLILLYFFSEILYFLRLNSYIPLQMLPFRIWEWKMLILSGAIQEDSILFIGKNLTIIGTIISYTFINVESKKKKVFLGTVLLIYIVLAFIYPRRDVTINKLVCLLVPFVFKYRNRMKKLIKLFLPIGVVFAVAFFYINNELTFGSGNIKHSIASYSFGAFNSLQKAIDVGYDSNSELPMGNTFYFIYMILKHIFPRLSPPGIVLESLGADTSNVYSALIAPVIDSEGSLILLVAITILYACWIGVCLVTAYNWYLKKQTVASMCFYSTIFSCVVRSFYNPTFSYSDILFGIIYSVILVLITQTIKGKGKLVIKI